MPEPTAALLASPPHYVQIGESVYAMLSPSAITLRQSIALGALQTEAAYLDGLDLLYNRRRLACIVLPTISPSEVWTLATDAIEAILGVFSAEYALVSAAIASAFRQTGDGKGRKDRADWLWAIPRLQRFYGGDPERWPDIPLLLLASYVRSEGVSIRPRADRPCSRCQPTSEKSPDRDDAKPCGAAQPVAATGRRDAGSCQESGPDFAGV